MLNASIEESLAARAGRAEISAAVHLETYFQPRWYAAYTRANHERRVAVQLAERGVENFLPQYESVRKWKDRKVRLQLPLFPGYIFVHLPLQNRLQVLQVPGVAHLVSFAGMPVPVPEDEFHRIRGFLMQGFSAEPHPFLKVGRRVKVKSGPLEGMEGIIERRKNGKRFVISLESIQRSMAVDISGLELVPAPVLSTHTALLSANG